MCQDTMSLGTAVIIIRGWQRLIQGGRRVPAGSPVIGSLILSIIDK